MDVFFANIPLFHRVGILDDSTFLSYTVLKAYVDIFPSSDSKT